ncbi:MAG: hypothetical protein AAFP86_02500 [Planctomycetota bacterium]
MSAHADGLRALRDALRPHADDPGVAPLVERLARDLLPRTAGGHDHLVVGLVGPNNSGKSALFNALVHGADAPGAPAPPTLSPSLATGGATRRLVGAAHPSLRAALEAEPTLERFRFEGTTPGPNGVEAATDATDTPDALLLVESPSLPESLLLVDTPDFDSVLVENRRVTDALLTVVDVALVVVTRHTYQNREVVDFLRAWLEHGRPWVLVYNESIDDATTARHAAKLEEDIGVAPEAVFASAYDGRVAAGDAALVPTSLPGQESGASAGAPLARWLRELGEAGDLKARALAASLDALRSEASELGVRLRAEAAHAEEVRGLVESRSRVLAESVAREAMPMGPFLHAFREVLDERPTAVQRELRRGARWTSRTIGGGARWIGERVLGRSTSGPPPTVEATLLDVERQELRKRWGDAFEGAVSSLRALTRGAALPEAVGTALDARFVGPDAVTAHAALRSAEDGVQVSPELLEEYRSACRRLIEAELDASDSGEWLLQLGVDALHLLPIGVAAGVIVHTGGLGADLAVAGGGAIGAAAAERLSRTLGTAVAADARRRWVELRSTELCAAALRGMLGADALRAIERAAERADAITKALETLRAETAR